MVTRHPSVGHRVRALRQARGLSQAELAGSELSKSFVSLLETGRASLSLRSARIIARRLDVPLSTLVDSADGEELGATRNALERALALAVDLERYARVRRAEIEDALARLAAWESARDGAQEAVRRIGRPGSRVSVSGDAGARAPSGTE